MPTHSRVHTVAAYLKAQPAVTSVVDAKRVYEEEIPDAAMRNMPKPTVVVSTAGGANAFGGGRSDFGDGRVDVRCYAWKTKSSVIEVEAVVYDTLRQVARAPGVTSVVDGVLLHWCREASGLIVGYEPTRSLLPSQPVDWDASWPFAMRSWQVMTSLTMVA